LRAACYEINCLATLLLGGRFAVAGVFVIVKVCEVHFLKEAGNFSFRVVNWFIGIHAQYYFFLGMFPLLHKLDQVIEEDSAWFGVWTSTGLQESNMLGSYHLCCSIELLIAHTVS